MERCATVFATDVKYFRNDCETVTRMCFETVSRTKVKHFRNRLNNNYETSSEPVCNSGIVCLTLLKRFSNRYPIDSEQFTGTFSILSFEPLENSYETIIANESENPPKGTTDSKNKYIKKHVTIF